MTHFNSQEFSRYTRHIQLGDIGVEGQRKLKSAHVLIVGCGGLGAPVSLYLAAAGVGLLTLVDGDKVELSNLQRQVIFTEADVGLSKAICAQTRLKALNSHIEVNAVSERLSVDNAEWLIQAADLVIDCTDNFATRYLINDVCKAHSKSWIYASVYQFSGQCALFTPEQSCFRCVFPKPPSNAPDCNSHGVLGVLPGLLGTLQATEAIKYLTGIASGIGNTLLLIEADTMQMQKIQLRPDENCFCCDRDFSFNSALVDYQPECNTARNENDKYSLTAEAFYQYQYNKEAVLLDVRDKNEHDAFNLGGLHVPLNELKQRLDELPSNKKIVAYCQSGVRSSAATQLLRQANLDAISVKGGIAEIISQ
ncbi:MAG: HesA/MoeB/ThiF family protein [Pseudomonadota bacterium]|nr:HesA/MoeB/ThiF family protein [Pseudomonadota bacterium]